MSSKRVILAGGSGFLGQSLVGALATQGYEVVVLTRHLTRDPGPARQAHWDGKSLGEWASLVDGAAAVVNLTGKSVNCRYTPENRREIIESRIDSVNVVGRAIAQCTTPPNAWVQAGSLAIYGDAGDQLCDEATPPGTGFPVETCLLWEEAFNSVDTPRTRKVFLRIGFALGPNGGALETLSKLARFFLGGTVGNGRQYISWLHNHDLNRMFVSGIECDDIDGVFNATGPTPVTNAEFMRELRRVIGRPWSPPAPSWAVRIGAALMGTEGELALTGRRCVPGRFLERGFEFKYHALNQALRDAIA
jgi:uncharacterized protein (TIGR01777 family)